MRTVTLFLVLAVASPARAGSLIDLVGGIGVPLGDKAWTDAVGSSPKLVGRVGGMNGELGGAVSVDWTNGNMNANAGSFGNISGNRFRILANLMFLHPLAPRILLSARAGAGVDIAHDSYQVPLLNINGSDTDVGVAFEVGGGVWFQVAGTTQLGAELGIPIGYHSTHDPGKYSFDYTSYDLDVLFGIRMVGN
jgi:hypothetical protein